MVAVAVYWLQKSPGQCPVGHCSAFLHKRAQKTLLLPFRGSISDILGSFQSRGALSGRRDLTIECLLMSGCGQGHELVKNMWKKLWLQFQGLTHSRSGNTCEKKGVTGLNKTSRKCNSVVKGLWQNELIAHDDINFVCVWLYSHCTCKSLFPVDWAHLSPRSMQLCQDPLQHVGQDSFLYA